MYHKKILGIPQTNLVISNETQKVHWVLPEIKPYIFIETFHTTYHIIGTKIIVAHFSPNNVIMINQCLN